MWCIGKGKRDVFQLAWEVPLIKRTLAAAVVLAFVSGPALASHCTKDVKKIQAAMSKLDKGAMMIAKEMSDKGLALHKAGKHGEAIKVLH